MVETRRSNLNQIHTGLEHPFVLTGHSNLVRMLLAEDWVGHPLRKDYEYPLEYHGIRGR